MTQLRVVAALIERGGTCLLAQRPVGKARAGFWEFPGGKVDEGETDGVALRRELKEELGVDGEVRELLGSSEHLYDGSLLVALYLYRFELAPGANPVGLESQQLAWVALVDIDPSRLCEADRSLLRALSS